jgi:flagellar motor switch protein FliG
MAQYQDREEGDDEEGETELPAMQKIAILFVALGQETSGEVMKFLSDYEFEEITQAVASPKAVSVEMQDKVLDEFEQHLLAGEWVSQGGMDFARGALERSVGPRKAQEILDRVASTVSSGFYMLKNVAPEQVAPFISHEHPQTIALILSQLDPAQASGILGQLPERMQADVAYLIAGGLSNRETADRLALSVRTIETHRQHVMDKLNIHSVAGLMKYAIAEGLTHIG